MSFTRSTEVSMVQMQEASMMKRRLVGRLPFARRVAHLMRKSARIFSERHLRWPIYDVSRYFTNRESRRLYQLNKARMAPRPIEQSVIQNLKDTGISVVNIDDVIEPSIFTALQAWANAHIQEPAIQERIKTIENGGRPEAKANKFYLVRPLGEKPHIDINDKVIELSLSDAILRIVSGYFEMLGRLTALDLWYNVPTSEPAAVSQRWHRDPEDRQIVKTFLYLRDVDETNGPFCYIPGSHNGGPYKGIHPQAVGRGNYPKDGEVDQRFSENERKVCTGKAGTLVFCDTTGFHRGGHATDGARVVLNAVYTTNSGTPLMGKVRQFSLSAMSRDHLDQAARYAIGHMFEVAK